MLRLSLHPDGLAPRIVNLGRVARATCSTGCAARSALTADPTLRGAARASRGLPRRARARPPPAHAIAVPLRLRTTAGELSFLSTVTTFGTAIDVTVAELSIEAFLPADEATATALRALPLG